MTLSEICIKRPVLASMLNLVLVIIGAVSLQRLPVRELPDIDPPLINITTIYPGANAQVVETEITERVEDVVNGVEGIKKITSESREELSSITVEFTLDRPIDLAAQDVRDRVSRVRGELPDDAEDPVIAKQDSDARPMLWVALYSERYSTLEITEIADKLLKDALATVSGVSSVILGGEKRFAIRVRLDADRMAAHGVTVLDVERALTEQNVELPSGRVENMSREFTVELLGELKSAEQFERLVVRQNGDTLIRLADIALVETGVEDERSVARYNSKPAMGLGIIKQSQANTIEVAKGIKRVLEERRSTLPEGVEAFVAYDESVFVEESIEQVWDTLYFAFILVVLAIFVFLRSGRSTLVPTLTIPVSIVATFSVLALMGFSVNILTMLGLVLAIGLVVDDSIVVLENIFRHIENGMKPFEAAIKGMQEITFAVIATTIALLAVFFPLVFQTTITGRLFIEFSVALCGAVLVSSFVALTLTPMVCSRVLKSQHDVKHGRLFMAFERFFEGLSRRYENSLSKVLRHRRLAAFFTFGMMLMTAVFYFLLNQEFLPDEDKGRLFTVAIAPEGATPEYTDRMVQKMESIIAAVPEVAGYFSAVALPREGPGKGSEGLMFVRFKPDRDRSLQDLLGGPSGIGARFFGEVEGAIAIPIMPKGLGGGFSQPFQLVLQHDNLEELDKFAGRFAQELRQTGQLVNVRSNFEINKPQLRVEIERDRAAAL
ncbi:MAG: efflux RND transporter permease subunit, partial [Bdellovibrionales bacterium]|nr:efflux RND transporter permease subunit [Bdellovibrionales bacterium]